MSEQLSDNNQQESIITEQLNADIANELSRAAFEQSDMSYMEWLDQDGYAGYLRRAEGQAEQDTSVQSVPAKNERGYREARAETLSELKVDPDRVAEQVVTKNGDSWSYVRDDEGRKHRIGSQEASDLAQSHYISLPEAEKVKVAGKKVSPDSSRESDQPHDRGAEIIPFPDTNDPEGNDELAVVREPVNANGNEENPDSDATNNEDGLDPNQEPENSPQEPKRRGAWDEFRRLAAERMLPAGLAERLHNHWGSKEEGDQPTSRRKKVAGALAALTFVTLVGGGIVNSSSPEDTPRDPGVAAGPEDIEDSTSDAETPLSPEVANFDYTVGEGHGVTHMVRELAQTMGYELSNDELLEVANRNADSFLSEGLTVPMDVPKGGETGGFQEAGITISAEAHKALFGSLVKDIKDVVDARSIAA